MQNLVFLHGFLENASMWNSLKKTSNKQNCFFIDFPCHGSYLNENPASCASIRSIAENVLERINKLELESYHCVGHSMGGYVALELAQMDKRLDKLVLFHSNHWADDNEKMRNRERVAKVVEKNLGVFLQEAIPNLFYLPENYAEHIATLVAEAKKLSPHAVANCSIAMKNRIDYSTWVAENKARCYFIQGEYDNVMPVEIARSRWAGKKKNYFEIKKCGHMGHIEQTERVEKILNSLLD